MTDLSSRERRLGVQQQVYGVDGARDVGLAASRGR
jgi:hypothetical protein